MSKLVKVKMTKDGSGNVLGPNLTLDIDELLKNFAEEARESELKQVTFVILRNIVLLRKLFSYYCAVGNIKHRIFEEKTSTMTRFQLWRFLKDTKVHHQVNHNLAGVDRAIASGFSFKDIHSPTEKFGLQDFLKCCVVVSYSIYKSDPSYLSEEANVLSKCLQQFLEDHLMNHSFRVGGQFLYESRRAMKALMYMENSWRVFQYCCQTYSNNGIPRMRQFLFMLRDLEILGKHLSTGTVLKILAFDDPFVCSNQSCNMELEMTFLEFFEALIGCGLCYGFDNMKLMSARNQLSSDVVDPNRLEIPADYSSPRHDDFSVWSKQVQNFFTKVLFPTWHNQQKITRAAQLSRIRSSPIVQSS